VGLDRIVVADSSSEPNTELTYIKQGSEGTGDGGDQYTGWDRFSRVIDQRWINSSGTALERVKYGYDRASNRIWRDNLVADGLSANQDEYYTYDGLYQLVTLKRGTLTGSPPSGISGTPTWEEDFTFDPTGNWSNYTNSIIGSQNRTHNTSNEIVAIAGSSTLIAYVANGNTTLASKPTDWTTAYNLTYDAWNRMVKVMNGTTTVATYAYDGLSRRVQKTTSSTWDYYYSAQWQILEERVGGASTYDRQFVWGLRHIDDLVLRDLNGGSPARLYALHDAMSVTAVEDTTGTVQERYGYNGFGQPRFMNSTFVNSSSSYTWETLFDAYRWDGESGFYQVRYRYLHPTLGRWLTRDPLYEPGFEMRDLRGLTTYSKWPNRDPIVELASLGFLKGFYEGKQTSGASMNLKAANGNPLGNSASLRARQPQDGTQSAYEFCGNDPLDNEDSFGLQRVGPPGGGYGRYSATCTATCLNGHSHTFTTTWFGYSVGRGTGQFCCQAATDAYCLIEGCSVSLGNFVWSACMAGFGTPPIIAMQ
jgi:YD repeat-containing protein